MLYYIICKISCHHTYVAILYITNNTHLQFSAYHWAEQKDLALLAQLTMMLTFSLPSSYVVSSNDICARIICEEVSDTYICKCK